MAAARAIAAFVVATVGPGRAPSLLNRGVLAGFDDSVGGAFLFLDSVFESIATTVMDEGAGNQSN